MEEIAELLSDDERAELDGVIAGLSLEARVAAAEAYVSGRVAGLCREGALELAADVVADAARTAVARTASEAG